MNVLDLVAGFGLGVVVTITVGVIIDYMSDRHD